MATSAQPYNRPVTRRSIAHRVLPTAIIDLTGSDLGSPVAAGAATAAVTVKVEKKSLYDELKEMEEAEDVVRNKYAFYCCQCSQYIDIYDGLSIRNCLHEICINCVRKIILESPKVDVKCPMADCEWSFQDREIRALLTQQEYANHVNQKTMYPNDENLYKELMQLEEQSGFIPSMNEFECEICLTDVGVGDGMMIRECLHQFCIDCIRNTINMSEDAEIKCPAISCECIIQDREIRSLITQAEFDKYSMKTLRIAESMAPNSFHCKKANCTGWALVDDNVIFFRCPICASDNCLSCQAIHPGQNCLQYQQDLKYEGMTDEERTVDKLDEIVKQNLGMRCPTCKVVIMKREGCDWLVCSMCKTELCWATKQSRWGPKGRGDTSAGCKCSPVMKCHPMCRNCH